MNEAKPRWSVSRDLGITRTLTSYINGQHAPVGNGPILEVEDPATGDIIATVEEAGASLIDEAVQSAQHAFHKVWRHVTPVNRGKHLVALAAVLRGNADTLAHLESLDTGKPLSQARTDIEVAAKYFDFYAGIADKFGGETIPQPETTFVYTVREPLGVVVQITPWNSPLSQMVRGVAPSLAMGNTVVVKPSEVTPISSLVAARLFVEAGLPPGVCNVVTGKGPTTGAALAVHPLVRHITFTGSVRTGQIVLGLAAANIVPCNLELGGKSPTLVFPDADLVEAAKSAARAVIRNSGQACVATTRIVAHRSIHDELVTRICEHVAGLTVGHGLDDPDLGPLASAVQKSKVLGYIDSARNDGAEIVAGGQPAQMDRGHFVLPTILTNVTNDMTVAREEVFGPVQSILKFDEEDEAVAIANDTPYGLAAGVFTRDIARAFRLTRQLDAGQVRINNFTAGGVETPFGGYKHSGIGREKGLAALHHYTQLKTVIMDIR